jgi:gluconolactonase
MMNAATMLAATVVFAATAAQPTGDAKPKEGAGPAAAAAAPLDRIVDSGTKPERLGEGVTLKFVEGPVWIASAADHPGRLLFSDIPADTIYQWIPLALGESPAPAAAPTARIKPSGHSNGLMLDGKGGLLVCQHDRRLVRFDLADLNGKPTALAERFDGKRLNSPNDLDVRSDGSIYFTDPPYGLGNVADRELDFNGVYRVGPDGRLVLLTKDLKTPNGIVLSPDEKRLYVADQGPAEVRVFDVAPDGSIGNNRLFAKANLDGMKVDSEGNLYGAGKGGVWVFDPAGTKLGVIAVDQEPANLCFGGDDRKTLYITARSGLYRIPVKVAGKP